MLKSREPHPVDDGGVQARALARATPFLSRRRLYFEMLWLGDVAAISVAAAGAMALFASGIEIGAVVYATCAALGFAIFSGFSGRYRPVRIESEGGIFKALAGLSDAYVASFSCALVVVFLCGLSPLIGRGTFVAISMMGLGALIAARMITAVVTRRMSRAGRLLHRRSLLLTYGSAKPEPGHVVGNVHIAEALSMPESMNDRWLDGDGQDLRAHILQSVAEKRIDHILMILPLERIRLAHTLAEMMEFYSIPIRISVTSAPDGPLACPIEAREDGGVIDIRPHTQDGLGGLVKTAMDKVLAGLGLVAISPLLALIALAIRLESRGPVLFRQRRHGYGQSVFEIYKFRSMRTLDDGAVIRQAQRNDPRVTKVGAFLRRTSLDELPQLWNVLRGEMSLVGPRPHAVAHNLEHEPLIPRYALRHSVKPGMTGWAQVNGYRGETQSLEKMKRRVDYDLWYIRHWSLLLDAKILLLTVKALVSGKNAH